ncbi:GNAT family N-acetyltransferase [Scytonema sp. UIC 10036]|uniref:GNAT family N-acetyltransferase n=1 Tax=Scytonema sp. UIC 10036 TaxID=2304196 RepID=UPI0012DA48D1|nr:GNAT family protein [Scytonema sp. UIC 10036]MUG91886.1 GNAT family N-acetyltransferase [Scytonema sp. UIC 10036]
MTFIFLPMNEANARVILTWRYDEPYDFYNPKSTEIEHNVQQFLDQENAYYTMTNARGDLVAYCCFGQDARVKGGDYSITALDVGFGLRPNLTRRGLTLRIINAVLSYAKSTFAPTLFCVTVAEFNLQALRICEKAGFQQVQTFQRDFDGKAFVVLTKKA